MDFSFVFTNLVQKFKSTLGSLVIVMLTGFDEREFKPMPRTPCIVISFFIRIVILRCLFTSTQSLCRHCLRSTFSKWQAVNPFKVNRTILSVTESPRVATLLSLYTLESNYLAHEFGVGSLFANSLLFLGYCASHNSKLINK